MTHFHDVISELRQPTRELKDARRAKGRARLAV